MDKLNLINNFEEWNESMVKKYNIEDYYQKSNFLIRFVEQRRLSLIKSMIDAQSDDDILDIGCGAGHVIEKFPSGRITGVDISESMLNLAKKRLKEKKVKLIKGNVEKLPFSGEKFDKIICTEVLEHIVKPQKAIDEIVRVSKENSVIVITIPNERIIIALKKLLKKLGIYKLFIKHVDVMNEWHLHEFDFQLLEKLIENKLRIIEKKAVPFSILPLRYIVKCRKIS